MRRCGLISYDMKRYRSLSTSPLVMLKNGSKVIGVLYTINVFYQENIYSRIGIRAPSCREGKMSVEHLMEPVHGIVTYLKIITLTLKDYRA